MDASEVLGRDGLQLDPRLVEGGEALTPVGEAHFRQQREKQRRGGEWMGQAFMCTRDKEFTIRGIGDCLARGYDRSGFFEVDTGEQRAWTVQLTESS